MEAAVMITVCFNLSTCLQNTEVVGQFFTMKGGAFTTAAPSYRLHRAYCRQLYFCCITPNARQT